MKEIKSALKETKTQKFYQIDQSNSGGSFQTDANLCHRLIIEANSIDEASYKAEDMGVYFNGVDEGYDCPCCGDRWYGLNEISFPYAYGSFSQKEALSISEKYGVEVVESTRKWSNRDKDVIFPNPETYLQYLADFHGGWTSPEARIFRLDGSVVEIYQNR